PRRARAVAGLGRAGRGHPAVAGVVAGDGAIGDPAADPLQPAPRGRAAGYPADAADDLLVVGVAGERAGRDDVRLAAGAGRAVVVVLLGPADRVAARTVRGRHRHRDPAAAVAFARRRGRGRLLEVARLGPADGDAGRDARRIGAGAAGRAADGLAVPLWRV